MTIREDIKILLFKEKSTLVDLARDLSLKFGKKMTANSISQKLSRNTMKFQEVKDILDCLGYDIDFKKRIE